MSPSAYNYALAMRSDRASRPRLLLPLASHPQNLDHPNKNVQKVQLQTNTLVNHILLHHSRIRQPRMMKNLLRIIEREPPKHSQPTIKPNVLC